MVETDERRNTNRGSGRILSLERSTGTGRIVTSVRNHESEELAEEIRDYIMENLGERSTIESLAAHFHISQTKLKETFRNRFGVPVYSYSRKARMEAAARDLMGEDISVTELAGRYGYDNASKFSKAFREINGLTPRDYRKANM
ncbi:MAG: AraC family transcriptional regulator [Clostridia bacterium]|nr:AraC family transcriptional regulator [Clostridia bacterium]